MITVSVLINGNPLFTRSAHRRTAIHARKNKVTRELEDAYLLDTGDIIYHNQKDGAKSLAIKLIQTIHEI